MCHDKAIELDPDHADTCISLGDDLNAIHQLDEAIAAYQEAIKLQPDNPHVYHSLGDALVKQGDTKAAWAAYRRVLEINPELTQVKSKIEALIFNQSVPLWSKGQICEAIEHFQEIDRIRIESLFFSQSGSKIDRIAGQKAVVDLLWPSLDGINWPEQPWNLADAFEKLLPEGAKWPKVSVITPSFNQGNYIEETILSILHQEYRNLEYIIVDGLSTDGTREILERYKNQVSEIIIEPDSGQSNAINKGFRRATGELITWLNSDDMLAPGALHMAALTYLKQDCDLVAGIAITHDDRKIKMIKKPKGRQHDFTVETLADIGHYWGKGYFFIQPEVIFTRRAWEKAGAKVDENLKYTMDCDLWFRMAQTGASLEVISWPIAFFRLHPGQKTANCIASLMEAIKLRNQYYTFVPTPGRKLEIANKLCSFLSSPRRRVLVLTKPADCLFSESTAQELNSFFSQRNYNVSFGSNLEPLKVTSFDAVVLLIHLKNEDELIWELRKRGFSGTVIAWFWKNYIKHHKNAKVADEVDVCIPGHGFIAEMLRNRSSILEEVVPLGTSEWTIEEAKRFFANYGYQDRTNELLVGFIRYDLAKTLVLQQLLPYKVVKLIEQLKGAIPIFHIAFWDKAQQDDYFGLTSERRFANWTKYKVSLFLALDNELSSRLFDALLWGQIPIVPKDILDLDQVIPPSIQAALPVIRLHDFDVDSVKETYEKALARFDAEGIKGIERRHKFARENNMFVHRIEAIFNILNRLSYDGVMSQDESINHY